MRKIGSFRFATVLASFMLMTSAASAASPQIILEGDLVSSYVCRGSFQTGASFQPTLGVALGGLSLTVWGSTDLDGTASSGGSALKEIDTKLKYKTGCGLAFWLTDYWWDTQGQANFLSFRPTTTCHRFEASASYTLPVEKFPLTVAWNTLFAGNDYNYNGKRAFSTYLEFTYPFRVKTIDMELAAGMTPYKSQEIYGCDRFAVLSLSAKGTYTIHACEGLDIPVFSKVVVNPKREEAHVIFGICIVPTGL